MRGTRLRHSSLAVGFGAFALGAGAAMIIAGRAGVSPLELAARSRAAQAADAEGGAAAMSTLASKLVAREQVLQATVDAVDTPEEYWHDESSERRARTDALIAAQTHARRLLTERFGTTAVNDPAFRSLFRPLERRFPWMTSAQQIAVHDAELRFGVSLDAADPKARASAFTDFVHRLEGELGADLMFEYRVRTSPLADQLRASNVALSEPEFREAYALLARLDEAEPAPDAYRDVRSALRDLLGSARFNALWAARDPRFATLARVGERHGLTPDTLISAYAVLNDAQDALLDAALRASGDAQADARRLRMLHDTSRARLAELVGADAARAIFAALSMPRDGRAVGGPGPPMRHE